MTYTFRKISIFLVHVLLLAFLGCQNEASREQPAEAEDGPALFTLLSPDQTNVDFQNTLTEALNTNILMYEYFYNGGGVAAGDLNGDGLIDLYFTANMSDNKLYINRGGLKFEEVTAASGAGGRPGPWKTGVTMVDVNGDNRLDLYVCYSGMLPDPKRANQLFINEGNDTGGIPRFSEKAAEYGLASEAFSNQGYFFDYDRDGDLDMLLLNHNPKNLPVLNVANTRQFLQQDDPARGVRLFRQHNGRFTDVTQQAGISGSGLTYGLGLGITDVNNDGWPDFYISNDYAVPDYLYMNNQDGTFTDQLGERLGHNSHFSMGNDVGDVNNDGWPDIVTLDMLPEDNRRQKLLMAPDNYAKYDLNVQSGFHHQIMRNMLQLNNGAGAFSEIGQLAGISNTDWSWAALLADYNNDGWKDLYITNGYFRDYTNMDFIKYMDDFVQSKGRLVRDDVLEIIENMPASDVINYIFANENGRRFANKTRAWGLEQVANSNGAAYADLDNDGDLDLIVNNINLPAFIYRNDAPKDADHHYLQIKLQGAGQNTHGIGARVTIKSNGQQQLLEQIPTRGYLSSVSPILHFGLGGISSIDTLIVRWPAGNQQVLTNVAADQFLTLKEQDAGPAAGAERPVASLFREVSSPISFQSPKSNINDFYRQPLLICEYSFPGPCLVKGDLNGDGLEDVFAGGASGQPAAVFLQQPNQSFVRQASPDFEADREHEDADAVLFDANGDGHDDIYVASGGYHSFGDRDPILQDRLYLNDGRGGFSRSPEALPEMFSSKGCVAVNDVNGDGSPDLFVGGRVVPGRYPETPASFLLINDGSGRFTDQTESMAPELKNMGMVTDAVWVDLDLDQSHELIVAGEWMAISVFAVEDGRLANKTALYFDRPYKGWWNKIQIADFNGDQKPDLLIGNFGTNTQFQITEREPAELYFKDFDNNGAVDPIFCFYIQGKSYPYVTRDELLNQLSGLRSRYTTFDRYADETITDIFDERELRNAGHLEANRMETTLFLSGTDGKFSIGSLPLEAQYAPVHTITVLDYDGDGKKDVLLCGNNNHVKLRLGKMDANYGTLLRGDGRGRFAYVPQAKSGFRLRGDVRSVIQLGETLVFGINQEEVVAYRLRK
jgi:hypothetical protein